MITLINIIGISFTTGFLTGYIILWMITAIIYIIAKELQSNKINKFMTEYNLHNTYHKYLEYIRNKK